MKVNKLCIRLFKYIALVLKCFYINISLQKKRQKIQRNMNKIYKQMPVLFPKQIQLLLLRSDKVSPYKAQKHWYRLYPWIQLKKRYRTYTSQTGTSQICIWNFRTHVMQLWLITDFCFWVIVCSGKKLNLLFEIHICIVLFYLFTSNFIYYKI